jgi:hypothetical protein
MAEPSGLLKVPVNRAEPDREVNDGVELPGLTSLGKASLTKSEGYC